MSPLIYSGIFLFVASVVLAVGLLMTRPDSRIENRVAQLAATASPSLGNEWGSPWAERVLPRMAVPLLSSDEADRQLLRTRLIHAGYYGSNSMAMFLGIKVLLTLAPLGLASASALVGLAPPLICALMGCLLAAVGLIIPSFWLDHLLSERQKCIRRALPDALDMVVICMDGGMSLNAALQRVAKELRVAHPLLAAELELVQRSGELGQTLPDALRQCASRVDLEELTLLARIIAEAERFGSSVAKALRVHAESLRAVRRQQAEEAAQRASIWILFPTMLFILPVTFFIVLAPAILRAVDVLKSMNIQP